MKSNILLMSLVIILFSIIGCSDLKVIYCQDGEPVTVVKDISKAYPVYAVTYDVGVKVAVKQIEAILQDASIDVGFKTQITKLRADLDQESSRFQMKLETVFLGFQTTPCDKKCRDEFWKTMNQLDIQTEKLSKIEDGLKTFSSGTKNIDSLKNIKSLLNSYEIY
jgi:hypothetical protein